MPRERRFRYLKCPRDVKPEDFEAMLRAIPSGFVYDSTNRWLWYRNFRFKARRKPTPESGMKIGDVFETAVVVRLRDAFRIGGRV